MCGSIGLSLILIYLTTWFVYIAGGPGGNVRMSVIPFVLASTVCIAMTFACRKDVAFCSATKNGLRVGGRIMQPLPF